MMRPPRMMLMRCASRSAISRMCVVRITVLPCATRATRMSLTWRAAWASRPVSGSSRISTCGSWISAPASASFWRMPREKPSTMSPVRSHRSSWRSSSSARGAATDGATSHRPATNSRYSSGRSLPYSSGSSGRNASTRLAAMGSAVMSCPRMRAVPASGRSSPATMRSVVVLPAPLGPSSAWNSPRGITRSRRSTAGVPPNCFTRPEISSAGEVVFVMSRDYSHATLHV